MHSEVFTMPKERMTLSVPDDLKKRMDCMQEVNWSGVVKQGIIKRLEALEEMRARGEI
jgi:hypothetical protein